MNISQLETDKDAIGYDRINNIFLTIIRQYREMKKEAFVGYYQTQMGFFMKTWASPEQRILLACLEHVNPDFCYKGDVKTEKVIVLDETSLESIIIGGQRELERRAARTPAAFLKYGLIVDPKQIAGMERR